MGDPPHVTTPNDPDLIALQRRLPAELSAARVAAADVEAERLVVVVERV